MGEALLEEGELINVAAAEAAEQSTGAGDGNVAAAEAAEQSTGAGDGNVAAAEAAEQSTGNGNDDMDCSEDPDIKAQAGALKRTRTVAGGASVEVTYKQLSRQSQRKLQELLLRWAEWHANHDFGDDLLEDGSETYFPALQTGSSRALHVWVDKPAKRARFDLDDRQTDVPLYDRACDVVLQSGLSSSEGLLEIPEEAARCFNCGSYSHALKDCQRPRDSSNISNARKIHNLRKGGPSTPSHRYYQSSKFEDIKPGVLRSETRQSLGIGENDPPPWLNRMRELGYPPGYIEIDLDGSSGLVMFGGESTTTEDGEIIEIESSTGAQKMTVEFPGINAPIPENADKRLWSDTPYYSESRSESRSRSSDHRSSRRDESALNRRETSSRRDASFRSLHHPDDYLTPPGETSPVRRSSRHQTTPPRLERSGAWAQAQAALDSIRNK